jgi:hypothetical protein
MMLLGHISGKAVGAAGPPYNPGMPLPGALTQAWTAPEAAVPLGPHVSGLYRFDALWVGLGEGPAVDYYASGSRQYAEQALRRLSDRLRERRGPTTG